MDTKGKFQNGAFVFSRARGVEPRSPELLREMALNAGIPESFVPEYLGDQVAFDRAAIKAKAGLARNGILLRQISRDKDGTVFGVVAETVDAGDKKVAHGQIGLVGWRPLVGHPAEVWGEEGDKSSELGKVCRDVIEAAKEQYSRFVGCVTSDDWTSTISSYLRQECVGSGVRGDGRIFWIPPQSLEQVYKFQAFMKPLGVDIIVCAIEPEAQEVSVQVATDSVADELARLAEEVEGFDGKQKAATFSSKLETCEDIRRRALMYREALGIGVVQSEEILSKLEAQLNEMLNVRKSMKLDLKTGELRDAQISMSRDGKIMKGHAEIGTWRKEDKSYVGTLNGWDKELVTGKASELVARCEKVYARMQEKSNG